MYHVNLRRARGVLKWNSDSHSSVVRVRPACCMHLFAAARALKLGVVHAPKREIVATDQRHASIARARKHRHGRNDRCPGVPRSRPHCHLVRTTAASSVCVSDSATATGLQEPAPAASDDLITWRPANQKRGITRPAAGTAVKGRALFPGGFVYRDSVRRLPCVWPRRARDSDASSQSRPSPMAIRCAVSRAGCARS